MTSKLPAAVWAFCLVAAVASIFALAPEAGGRVATHFGWAGRANGWMSEPAYAVSLAALAVGLSSFVVGICYCIRFFPPDLLNVPNAGYWRAPEHFSTACGYIFRHSFWLGAISASWVGLLNYLVVRANLSTPPHLSSADSVLLAAAYLVAIAIWAFHLVQYFRINQA